jgi:hypothetical protein
LGGLTRVAELGRGVSRSRRDLGSGQPAATVRDVCRPGIGRSLDLWRPERLIFGHALVPPGGARRGAEPCVWNVARRPRPYTTCSGATTSARPPCRVDVRPADLDDGFAHRELSALADHASVHVAEARTDRCGWSWSRPRVATLLGCRALFRRLAEMGGAAPLTGPATPVGARRLRCRRDCRHEKADQRLRRP